MNRKVIIRGFKSPDAVSNLSTEELKIVDIAFEHLTVTDVGRLNTAALRFTHYKQYAVNYELVQEGKPSRAISRYPWAVKFLKNDQN